MTDTVKPRRTRRFARTPVSEPEPGNAAAAHAGEQCALAPATAPEPELAPTAAASPELAGEATPAAEPAAKPETKSARVIALLQREEGASLEEMVAATGWLPHTTRAAMTGLKRKGHTITSVKVDGVRRYHAVAVPTSVAAQQ